MTTKVRDKIKFLEWFGSRSMTLWPAVITVLVWRSGVIIWYCSIFFCTLVCQQRWLMDYYTDESPFWMKWCYRDGSCIVSVAASTDVGIDLGRKSHYAWLPHRFRSAGRWCACVRSPCLYVSEVRGLQTDPTWDSNPQHFWRSGLSYIYIYDKNCGSGLIDDQPLIEVAVQVLRYFFDYSLRCGVAHHSPWSSAVI